MKDFWNQRYQQKHFAYGKQANAFFLAFLESELPGRLLLPAEGEGRNAVSAALRGWQVDAFDFSEEGRSKALNLAKHNGVEIHYSLASFQDMDLGESQYDAIALIYAHIHGDYRRAAHRQLLQHLKPGGQLLLEAFSKEQLNYSSGGPPDIAMLYTVEELREDFEDLSLDSLQCKEILLDEGKYHQGLGSVIQLRAHKPA
ncbi:MAG: class I SAM-dependent methyltransferase [Gammaproteobacteria bacterium]|nr:MAG: class I SAM-dependent methyltransferase [Gammaproteobacteria bacterium]